MPHHATMETETLREASADQRDLQKLIRALRIEITKRISDIPAMNPEEIKTLCDAVDQLDDLIFYANSFDDRLESFRERLLRVTWE